MAASFKKSKIILTLFAIVSFFSFNISVHAQTAAEQTANIAGCVSTAIVAGFGATMGASLAVELIPSASITQTSAEGAAAAGVSGAGLGAVATGVGKLVSVSVPVGDLVGNGLRSLNLVVDSTASAFQNVAKMSLDSLAYKVGQCMLTELTNSTVRWIQGGFTGNPRFAVDTTKLFQDISAGVLEDFSNQIKNLQACDFTPNFKYDLANSVQLSAPARNKIPAKIACPFGPMNVTASQFYAGTSQVFSWALFETALSDNGNQFAVKMITAEEAARRQAEVKATADQKLNWSNGFADIVDTEDCPEMPQEVILAIANGEFSEGAKKSYQQSYCKTTTPGKMIEGQLTKSLGINMDKLGFADNMNKIVSALIDQITKQTLAGVFKRL